MSFPKVAIIAGGTGLVGRHVIEHLVKDSFFDKIYVLNRRTVDYDSGKVHEIIVDFEDLSPSLVGIQPTHAFCTLGTTIKKAGSREAFRKVDQEYVMNFALAVFSLGCKNFNVVTALGTNKASSIFYNQVKFEVSQSLEKVGFEQLNIIQPSLLLGDREEKRLGEDIMQLLFKYTRTLWAGPLKNVAGIQGSQVAKAMVAIAKKERKGVYRIQSRNLHSY
ncbi:MAG TPA: hypothetical protein VFD65_03375 [Chitinophagales bacterium]|nr:hypothetical protein [Chitinophagales bacterium]